LAEGLTRALSRRGGAPPFDTSGEHRSDSLSAAFKNLSHEAQEDITRRYQALCWNSGMEASRNQPGVAHENGAIESPHGHLKRRIERTLLRRGTAEFASLADYQAWLDAVTAAINQRNQARIEEERPHLLRYRSMPLPAMPAVDYTELFVRVTSTSNVRLVVYSVPSRLIGERLRVHLYDDRLLCYVGTTLALELPRIYPVRGKRRARCIDYRHLIDGLVKKPMAFYHSQLRDDLLPSETYHRIWRALKERLDARSACKLMVGCLHLAAHYDCEQALGDYVWQALAAHGLPTLVALQQRFGRPGQGIPAQVLQQHPLADYDSLLECFGAEVVHA
jgi:hypothetical protein